MTSQDLLEGIRMEKRRRLVYECKECPEKFPDKYRLANHVRNAHRRHLSRRNGHRRGRRRSYRDRLCVLKGTEIVFRSKAGAVIYEADIVAHFRSRNGGGDMLLLTGVRKHRVAL